MNSYLKRKLIALVTFLGGLYFFLEYALPQKLGGYQFSAYHDEISRGVVIVGSMAIGLGVINILRVHGAAILKARKGWGNSLALLLGLVLMLAVEGGDLLGSETSVSSWKKVSDLQLFSRTIKMDAETGKLPAEPRLLALEGALQSIEPASRDAEEVFAFHSDAQRQALRSELSSAKNTASYLRSLYALKAADQAPTNDTIVRQHNILEKQLAAATGLAKEAANLSYEQSGAQKFSHFLQHSFFFPLGAAMFSLLAFYIASAAYRSFRIRSLEALFMMLAAVVVILGQIPHGPLYISESVPGMRLWLLENLSTPAFRAIYFGAAVAGLALAVRMWLSLERSPLSDDIGTDSVEDAENGGVRR